MIQTAARSIHFQHLKWSLQVVKANFSKYNVNHKSNNVANEKEVQAVRLLYRFRVALF